MENLPQVAGGWLVELQDWNGASRVCGGSDTREEAIRESRALRDRYARNGMPMGRVRARRALARDLYPQRCVSFDADVCPYVGNGSADSCTCRSVSQLWPAFTDRSAAPPGHTSLRPAPSGRT
jgi:hypothetical protein